MVISGWIVDLRLGSVTADSWCGSRAGVAGGSGRATRT